MERISGKIVRECPGREREEWKGRKIKEGSVCSIEIGETIFHILVARTTALDGEQRSD